MMSAFNPTTSSRSTVRSDKKRTVLAFVPHYLPGYKCGPIHSVSALVDASTESLDFRIVTSDRDAGEEPYATIETNKWQDVGTAKVLYLSKVQRSIRTINKIMTDTPHDAVYLNSFFDVDFTIKPLVARYFRQRFNRPTVIAPRGELSKGALRSKGSKKKLYLLATRIAGLYRGLIWQASSELEKSEIKCVLGLERVIVAPNLVPPQTSQPVRDYRVEGDPLRVCYLSRISEKKNLEFAIEVLKRVSCAVEFSVFGTIEDASCWARCQRQMEALPANVHATYVGSIEHRLVPSLLASQDLFFLPTLGENFGHVIYESLAAGTPVLISDRTPWRDLERDGSGWDIPLEDMEGFRQAVEYCSSMDGVTRSAMRRAAVARANHYGSDANLVIANLRLFDEAFRQSAEVPPRRRA